MITMQQALTVYKTVDAAIKAHNPCDIKTENGQLRCARGPALKSGILWCCEGCRYASPAGCTTQSLSCKLGFCSNWHPREYIDVNNPAVRVMMDAQAQLQESLGRYVPWSPRHSMREERFIAD